MAYTITFTSTPSGADILRRAVGAPAGFTVFVGKTPRTITFPDDAISFEITTELKDFEQIQSIVVGKQHDGRTINIPLRSTEPPPPPPPEEKETKFESVPPDARVFLNNFHIGNTPVNSTDAKVGDTVKFDLDNHRIVEFDLDSSEIGKRVRIILVKEEVTPPPPPEEEDPKWWTTLLDFLVPDVIEDLLSDFQTFSTQFNEVLGENPTLQKLLELRNALLNFIVPLNTLSKLFTGKNLKGENEEFELSEDWLDIILLAASIIPIGRVGAVGLKLSVAKISSSEAAKLSARLGQKTIVDKLIKIIKKHPETTPKFLAKFPQPVREAVISGMYKTPSGRIAIVTLSKLGYFKQLRPFWKKILIAAGASTGAAVLLTTIIGSYPFAGFLKEEALQTLGFAVRTARENRDLEGMRVALDKQKEILDVTLWENFLAKIPYVNILAQLRDFYDAAKIKLEIDETVFEELKKELEEEPPTPEEAITITNLSVFPTVTQVGNSVTITANASNTGSSPITADFGFEVRKDGEIIHFNQQKEIVIPEGFNADGEFIFPTENLSPGFYDVNVDLFETGTTNKLAEKLFTNSFQLTEEKEPAIGPGILKLSVSPEDALIEVKGQPQINVPGDFELEKGSYSIVVTKEGLRRKDINFFIKSGESTVVSIILTSPEETTLTITGKPDDAIIEVGGFPEINSQSTFTVQPGTYQVRASKDGFTSFQSNFFLKAGEEKVFSFNLQEIDVEEPKGAITINTNPQGAKISIDGVFEFDVSPVTIFQKAGEHLVRMALDDYEPKEETLMWNDNVNKEETFDLTPTTPKEKPTPARVLITSDPTGAKVTVDGVFQFTTTPFTVFLEVGEHIIRVEKEDFVPSEITIEVESGEDFELPFILTNAPPAIPPIPAPTFPDQIPISDFGLLGPGFIPFTPLTEIPLVVDKELLINIETTDVLPWKGRIYSIASLDLSDENAVPNILVSKDEESLIRQFSDFFSAGNFTKLVGFKTTFDHRFIFAKMMLYRIKNKSWAEIKMRDVKQILDQVKEEFVYFPSKKGTLDDWGKHLFGVGKFGKQETILREFIAGNFDYVTAFQMRQIEITTNLYALARFVASESPETGSSHLPEEETTRWIEQSSQSNPGTHTKPCKKCLQVNPFDSLQCLVCGDPL